MGPGSNASNSVSGQNSFLLIAIVLILCRWTFI